jgi:hypothetical protein
MEQSIPPWLNAAVEAAGMTLVYNADDWRGAVNPLLLRDPFDTAANDPSAAPH